MNKKSLDAVGFDHTRGMGKIDIIPHEKPEKKGGYSRSVIKLGKIKFSDRKFPSGNIVLGTAVQAIEYALAHLDDHFDMREFLNDWMHGDVEEWVEYQGFLSGNLKQG